MPYPAFTFFASDSKSQNWLSVVTYPVFFLLLQIFSSFRSNGLPFSSSELAVVEALKLAFNVFIRYRSSEDVPRQTLRRTVLWDASRDFEEQPLHGLASQDCEETAVSSRDQEPTDAWPTTRSWLTAVSASVVWASTTYISSSSLFFFDAVTVHFASAISIILVFYGLYAFEGRGVTAAVSQTIALLLLGVLLTKTALPYPSHSSHLAPSLILLAVVFTSACNVLIIDKIYHRHATTLDKRLNTLLFSSGLALHLVVCSFQAIFISSPPAAFIPHWSLPRICALTTRAGLDWTILSVIRNHDAILERVLYSLSLALLLFIVSLHNKLLSVTLLLGFVVALWSSTSYISKELYKSHHQVCVTAELDYSVPTRRRRFIAWAVFTVLGLGSILGAIEVVPFRSEKSLDILSFPGQPVCQRRPLHFSPPHSSDGRKYKHFDNVLLIVFFSHARYDTNLDFYREVYADYFPNILFIGPANREDLGFDHSYDVLVDTYQAEEDLSDLDDYKIGGRMAHHMLYTALQEHPCYDGYLWAPFDTLLNVPRLQLFDQDKFWYHSPFGRYIPNPALDPAAIGNASFHAPAANISPDPASMTTPWKGWSEEWWWGSPHVGLSVCMQAVNKVPEAQRDRLAALMGGVRDRFIGGSADTMYIPGRHRATFMSTLALFLQTNCFLEIAAPTTLHLTLPPDEEILFVDHWWIWQPPFDTAFVRGQWAQGREVDSFHSFHWGEPSGEGEGSGGGGWDPQPERIGDVRQLLQDSAARQGISFP